MIHITDNYYIDSDGTRNFILVKKSIVGESEKRFAKTKTENIGKETYYTLGYYSSVGALFRSLHDKKLIESLPSLGDMTIDEYFKKQDAEFASLLVSGSALHRTLADLCADADGASEDKYD